MKKPLWKKIALAIGILLGVILLALIGLILFLTVTEYKPADRQKAEFIQADSGAPSVGTQMTLYSWNIGYAGLGKESDFFMDGGQMVNPPSQQIVEKNLAGIEDFIRSNPADAWLLQEVDINSAHTEHINELQRLSQAYGGSHAFAYNYKCPFVPIPVPPIGQVASGIATLTSCKMDENAERIALPCPFSWPVSAANLKRCLLITRLPVEGSNKELVLINLHLEAYDDGAGKIAQTKLLMQVLEQEYAKGNYVIAGGDFNQTFPGGLDAYPIADPEKWTPGVLEAEMLPEGWQFAYDVTFATCRLLDQPYSEECQKYVIDGFILSPNVRMDTVETIDMQFQYSDHNPVRLNVTLLPE